MQKGTVDITIMAWNLRYINDTADSSKPLVYDYHLCATESF
jgi:hypothetical protein